MAKLKVENGALAYTGSWTVQHTANASLHSRHDSDGTEAANASASWSGYIRGVDIYATKGNSFGKASVFVDDVLHGEIDLYNASAQHGVLVYSITDLAAGFHTISIRKNGTKNPSSTACYIDIDYLTPDFVHPGTGDISSIICIGDSITFGANVTPRPDSLYGRRLQQMLTIPVSIHGLSGAPVHIITQTLEAVVAPRKPDLFLWLAGMNNANPRADLERGFDKIRELVPNARIIGSTIQYNTYYSNDQNMVKVNEVKAACLNKGVRCADLYTATAGNAYINEPEGTVHPNADGQCLIANLFYNEIVKLLRNE
ncbi:SGNH/GDSL hydrolase family protein [Paenibacillus lautus]|uniref:SGNH/GDSL hydrolase family protein n=1 Tax=Paenibacillus lautus TaxID=1401 RepID=UPI002DB9878C|nr:SGNH/GDSL hydrolase family protein [Paenibacillus lautus]MEC0259610.1 SGNH/GDSL hydrolase family protein [Paenibacillus lautus]